MPLRHSNAALLPGAHRRNGHGALPTPMGRRADKGRRRLGPGLRFRNLKAGNLPVYSFKKLLRGFEAPVVRRKFTSKLTVHAY